MPSLASSEPPSYDTLTGIGLFWSWVKRVYFGGSLTLRGEAVLGDCFGGSALVFCGVTGAPLAALAGSAFDFWLQGQRRSPGRTKVLLTCEPFGGMVVEMTCGGNT